jgi:proteasome lid subunit RPN8/RPN11
VDVVTIARPALDAIVAHARGAAPRECCGILVGIGGRIVEAVPSANLADDPKRFLIDPRTHIAARRDARAHGCEVVGFYHSHPRSEAEPSETDRAEASYPDHVYLIVGLSVEPPDVRAFRLEQGNFRPLTVVTGS